MNDNISKPKILFVDDESQVLDGIRRILYPFKREWDLYYALSGEEALKTLENTKINIVISDMRMPGMNGAELLKQVKQNHPETIRIILSGHSDEEMIMKSVNVAHQFLSKPCEASELIETIKRTFFVRIHLKNESLIKVINGVEELPKMPEVLLKLEAECNRPNVSIGKITGILSEDIGLSAKVLQLVNSAFFGLPTRIADLEHAVSLLGLNTLRSLILFFKLEHETDAAKIPRQHIKQILDHSLLVANYSRIIYEHETQNYNLSKEAFAAGLLHDIGKLILFKYPNYIDLYNAHTNEDLYKAELSEFNVTHAEVGAYLLSIWNLPDSIVEAVAFHHTELRETKYNLAFVVNIANKIADEEYTVDCDSEPGLSESKLKEWREICSVRKKEG